MTRAIVVIGAGVNELVAARALARGGHAVTVVEQQGIAPATPEFGWNAPRIIRALALGKTPVDNVWPDPWLSAPLPDGRRLELRRDMARSVESIRQLSDRDAAKWPAFSERMARLARLLETVYLERPPDPLARGLRGLAQLGSVGLRLRRLGRPGLEDLLRLIPMSVADLLDDWFESDAVKGALGAVAVSNLCMGPRSGGTALRLLHHHVGSPPGVFNPPGSNLREILAGAPGLEIRRVSGIANIVVRAGCVAGVVLADGEEIAASTVLSGMDPKRTLLDLADPAWLDPELIRAVRNIRSRGVVAQVDLALERVSVTLPFVVAPSLDYLERAYDGAKHGRVSADPVLRVCDAGSRTDGRRVLRVHVQYAPYGLRDGSWDDSRRAMLANDTIRVLARLAPEFAGAEIVAVMSPADLETAHGWPEGQAEHAEPALDQLLWMRPVPEMAQYRTPMDGLYLCGPAMHPGSGIAGACGYNAALAVARDLRS